MKKNLILVALVAVAIAGQYAESVAGPNAVGVIRLASKNNRVTSGIGTQTDSLLFNFAGGSTTFASPETLGVAGLNSAPFTGFIPTDDWDWSFSSISTTTQRIATLFVSTTSATSDSLYFRIEASDPAGNTAIFQLAGNYTGGCAGGAGIQILSIPLMAAAGTTAASQSNIMHLSNFRIIAVYDQSATAATGLAGCSAWIVYNKVDGAY